MGIVYIKLAQILAMQNLGNVFTEEDRNNLSSVCDSCNPIEFKKIKAIIKSEYKQNIKDIFESIDSKPLGSASVSQVHKAVLKDGTVVSIKVKRTDITKNIESDIKTVRKLMTKYGRFVGFKNFLGGNKALDLYLTWIYEEIDFEHEKENIIRYNDFANSVNGKVENTKTIQLPQVYEELCTENIIVMDYVDSKTINQLKLDESNKKRISEALNSYLQLSFYALFNDKKIIFHGDPHSGNIYIDKNDNIGFLDMGLIFELSPEDSKLTRDFFLAAFTGDSKKLCEILLPFGKFNLKRKEQFEKETSKYCQNIKTMPVTSYFMEMVNVCLRYDISPPDFLFCMAKAFVCLHGISGFSENMVNATRLLKEQIVKFYIKRSISESLKLAVKGLAFVPKFLEDSSKNGLIEGIENGAPLIESIQSDLKQSVSAYKEILELLNLSPNENKVNCDN